MPRITRVTAVLKKVMGKVWNLRDLAGNVRIQAGVHADGEIDKERHLFDNHCHD
jgi:hypothetical protein